jgi:hypothetical protein
MRRGLAADEKRSDSQRGNECFIAQLNLFVESTLFLSQFEFKLNFVQQFDAGLNLHKLLQVLLDARTHLIMIANYHQPYWAWFD